MKILNIYGQEDNHTEARIIGNREGLETLKKTIDRALRTSKATTDADWRNQRVNRERVTDTPPTDDPLFASDGEGYEVIVEMHNDGWGIAGSKDNFWNKKESCPQYIILERGKLN